MDDVRVTLDELVVWGREQGKLQENRHPSPTELRDLFRDYCNHYAVQMGISAAAQAGTAQ